MALCGKECDWTERQSALISFAPAAPLSVWQQSERRMRRLETTVGSVFFLGDLDSAQTLSRQVVHPDGEALICLRKKTEFKLRQWTVTVKPGAMIFLSGNEHFLQLQVLWETSADAIKVSGPGTAGFSLRAGQEIIAAQDEASLTEHLSSDAVLRQDSAVGKLADGTVMMSGHFQMISALKGSKLCSCLRKSASPTERHLWSRALKMAACLHYLGGDHVFENMITTERCYHAPHIKVR